MSNEGQYAVPPMSMFISRLSRLPFSNEIPPVRLARTLGLDMVNRMASLKRAFVKNAMGQMGRLPKLMRGEQIWVPETRTAQFDEEARRQSLAVAKSACEPEDQAFIDAITD